MHTVSEIRQRSADAQEKKVSHLFEDLKRQLDAPRENGELWEKRLVLYLGKLEKKLAKRAVLRLEAAGYLKGFHVSYEDAYLDKGQISKIVVTW